MENTKSADVICIGQMVVDCITRNRRITATRKNVYTADGISLNPGGDALNESMILKKLGHRVRLMGALGPDAAGTFLLSFLKGNGISVDDIDIHDSVTTPVANLLVAESGERESINSKATMLGSYRADPCRIGNARVLSLASLFRAPLDRADSVRELVEKAKECSMIICADTKLPTFRQMDPADLKELYPLIDYIFPNENEAQFLTGEKDYDKMAASLKSYGVKNVIIKAGPAGSFVYPAEGPVFQVPALPVKAIDSTGAGDSYVAGFISGLLKDYPIRECACLGTHCAAACVQKEGATSGISGPVSPDQFEEMPLVIL